MPESLETARTTPPDIHDASKYIRVPAVPVFDENCRFKRVAKEDGTTEVVKQCVDKERLETICRNSQKRAEEGNYGLLFIGHTDEDKPEHEQPLKPGYIDNFRLGLLEDQDDKAVILVDYYISKKFLAKHKIDDAEELLDEYPRRSAEVVGKTTDMGFIDSVALLKRTPYRTLGLVTHNLVEYDIEIDRNSCSCGGSCPSCSTAKENNDMSLSEQIAPEVKSHPRLHPEDRKAIVDDVLGGMKAMFIEAGKVRASASKISESKGSESGERHNPQEDKTILGEEKSVGEDIDKQEKEGNDKVEPQAPVGLSDKTVSLTKTDEEIKKLEGIDTPEATSALEKDENALSGLAQSKADRALSDNKEDVLPPSPSAAASLSKNSGASVATAFNKAPTMAGEETEKDNYRMKYEEMSKDYNKALIAQLDYSRENEKLKIENANLKTKLTEEVDRNRLFKREAKLAELHSQGYDFDLDKFKLKVKGKSDEDFDEMVEMIEHFSRSTVGADLEDAAAFVDVSAGSPKRPEHKKTDLDVSRNRMPHDPAIMGRICLEGDEQESQDITRFALKHKIKDPEEAVRAFLEAKQSGTLKKTGTSK